MAKSIRSDLQDLIEAEIINPEIAGNIQRWYEHNKEPVPNRFVLVFGVVGSLLVGLGIVLPMAHNWDALYRHTKTIFAFIPLLPALLIVIYVLVKLFKGDAVTGDVLINDTSIHKLITYKFRQRLFF